DFVIRVQLVLALGDVPERDQHGTRNAVDLILVRLANVDDLQRVATVEPLFELDGGDFGRGVHGDRLRGGRRDAAELFVIDELLDGGVGPANRAVRLLPQLQLAELHAQRVEDEETPDERLADVHDQLERLGRLDHADDSRQNAAYSAFGTRRHEPRRRRLRIQAAVAGAAFRCEYGRLPLETKNTAVRVRLAEQHARVVHEITRRKIVGAVEDDVVRLEQLEGILRRQRDLVRFNRDVRIERVQTVSGRRQLRTADVRRPVQDLALQVAEVDDVEVHQAERADAGGGEIHRRGRAEPAGADAQDLGGLQLALTLDAHLRHDQMAAVAFDLVIGQLRQRGKGVRPLFRDGRRGKGAVPLFLADAAGHRRDDADRVARPHGRLLLLQISNVLVIHVHV